MKMNSIIKGLIILLLAFCLAGACAIVPNKTEDRCSMEENKDPDTGEEITLTAVAEYTSNSGGPKPLPDSPYSYEMWTQGGNNNKLIWYGPEQGGGAAFRTEWNNPSIYLGRVGLLWGNGGEYTEYKNIFVDFKFTRSGRNTAGSHSYIGIYGWSRNPAAEKSEEKLIEYYVVDDWYGNQWQSDETPLGINTTGGKVIGTFFVDGSDYQVITNIRVNQPSIEGTKTFIQYFSVRQEPRQCGTISVTEHFKKWEEMGLALGSMYEAKFLVEAGSGTGWFDASYLAFRQED